MFPSAFRPSSLRRAVLSIVAMVALGAQAAPGDLVARTLTPFPGGDSRAFKVVAQPDGRMLVAGYASLGAHELAVTRLNADGTVDRSYGTNRDGTQLLALAPRDNEAFGAALQPDGKLVVVGHVGSIFNIDHMAVARLNADGSLDTTFANRVLDIGPGNSSAHAVVVQPDGRILVGGSSRNGTFLAYTVIRLDNDGSLDTTYGVNGVYVATDSHGDGTIAAMALQPDGRLVVVGDDGGFFKLQRIDANGSVDTSWGTAGSTVTTNLHGRDVAVQPNGEVVVGGDQFVGGRNAFAVMRFTASGAFDPAFGSAGIARAPTATGTGSAIALQPDGRIALVGQADDIATPETMWIFRFNADGTPDATFGTNGEASAFGRSRNVENSVLLRPDGGFIVAGSFLHGPGPLDDDTAVTAFTSGGAVDTAFNGTGRVLLDLGSRGAFATASVVQPDGKLVMTGTIGIPGQPDLESFVARYLAKGALDVSFGSGGVTRFGLGNSNAIALQPDGRIVVGGQKQLPSGTPGFIPTSAAFARFNADGTPDATFGSGGIAAFLPPSGQDWINGIAIQPDGMIVGAGYVTTTSGHNGLVLRATASGTLDTTFGSNGLATVNLSSSNDELDAIALQPDGRIVVAGWADVSATQTSMAVARLMPDGTPDAPFASAIVNYAGASSRAHALALQPDGRIVLAGFANSGADDDYALVRLLPQGGIDASFGDQGFVRVDFDHGAQELDAVKVLASGKIVGAGGDTGGTFGVVQLLANGMLDTAFGTGGHTTIAMNPNAGADAAMALSVASDGTLFLAGDASGVPGLAIVAGDAVVVARATPSVSLASSGNPSTVGQAVTFTSVVSGSIGTPTGSVDFLDGTSAIAGCSAVALNAGTATCTTSALAAGPHSITAQYPGDASYDAATSSAITQTVQPNPARLANISTRGEVLTGDDVLIGGFIIGGSVPKTVVVVAQGPSLAGAGVPNPLANPTMTLVRSSDHAVVATNDDWQSAPNAADIAASGFAPGDARESAILVTLEPGAYTAIVSGVGGGTGVGLVAVYRR
jgi:uncharacterized delta-60 repeat protein